MGLASPFTSYEEGKKSTTTAGRTRRDAGADRKKGEPRGPLVLERSMPFFGDMENENLQKKRRGGIFNAKHWAGRFQKKKEVEVKAS